MKRKLILQRDTIRRLTGAELTRVDGGEPPMPSSTTYDTWTNPVPPNHPLTAFPTNCKNDPGLPPSP
jgi:hypothetical protein